MEALDTTLDHSLDKIRQTAPKQQSLTPSSKSSLAIRDDASGQKELARELYDRFHAMKTYGKEPESLKSIVSVFIKDLSAFPASAILRAIQTHSQRSQEFPTVADIVGLIRRNGRPEVTESQYIAVTRKDGADRTPEDWQLLRNYETARNAGWDDERDARQCDADRAEMIRLREEVLHLRTENRRLADLLHESRMRQGLVKPKPTVNETVMRTIAEMRRTGCPASDIEEFAAPYGGLASLESGAAA